LPLSGQKRVDITMSDKLLSDPMLARTVEMNVATIVIAPVITLVTAGSSAVEMTVVAKKAEEDV
jgi:hypothetical protein